MTQEELDAFTDLQMAYNDLSSMYEKLRTDLIEAHKTQRNGVVFMFSDGVEKFVPFLATTRGITHNSIRPYKFMLTFDQTILQEWIHECEHALDPNMKPEEYIPVPGSPMPEPPENLIKG